ncbi:MAG: hypothetical protein N3E52_06910 [Candidatus Bathyarchaeota archaeon]|nr:hypothetical protein [Candidatus Bathyarchaeota archaeon]
MFPKVVLLALLARGTLYSLIITVIDISLLFLIHESINQITFALSLLMLLEGGVGLTIGGIVAFYSPICTKISEILFHTKPWTAQRQKEAEKQARTWIITGLILMFAAFVISAF